MSGAKTDNEYAWEILNLIFVTGDYYIQTEFQHPQVNDGESVRELVIDGVDRTVTAEQIAWIEKTFWSDDKGG